MVFKKGDTKTKEASKKGVKALKKGGKLYGVSSIEWRRKNPEKWEKILKEFKSRSIPNLNKINSDPNHAHQIYGGKRSRYYENKGAEILKEKYDVIFQPFVVCDRICIDGNKIVFAEIKQEGQELKPKQKEFKEICDRIGIKYKIVYVAKGD